MTKADAIRSLEICGIRISKTQLDYAIRTGRVGKPGRTIGGAPDISEFELEEIKRHFSSWKGKTKQPYQPVATGSEQAQ